MTGLSYWLSEEGSRGYQESASSVLRDMAWNRAQFRGLAAACLGTGISLAGAAILAFITDPGSALPLVFLVCGAGLVLSGVLVRRRVARIPKLSPMMTSRAPGTLSSGIGLTVFLSLPMGVMMLPLMLFLLAGPGGGASCFAAAVLFLVAMTSIFTAPAYFIQHANRDFRSDILADPALRTALDALAAGWRDPLGNRGFGPL